MVGHGDLTGYDGASEWGAGVKVDGQVSDLGSGVDSGTCMKTEDIKGGEVLSTS